MKRILITAGILLSLFFCKFSFADTGLLFDVAATGIPDTIHIILCLNGEAPLSCQNYTVSGPKLTIRTTIPNHNYPSAGIKITTPGFTPLDCTPINNGYCLFQVSQNQPANILLYKNSGYQFTVGGAITGLTSAGLVLQNNGGDNLKIPANATSFQFSTPIASGSDYKVTILKQPTGLFCTVKNGSGTNIQSNVSNVLVSCATVTLYGNTGQGSSSNPNSLYTMDVTTGLGTFIMNLESNDGAVIASDGKTLYHWTGFSTAFFESIDLNTLTTTPIPLSGDYISEVYGAVFSKGSFLLYDIASRFYTSTTSGVVTEKGSASADLRGIACFKHRFYAVNQGGDELYEINPADGSILTTKPITLSGFVVTNGISITAHPSTGTMYALLKVNGGGNIRKFVTIDVTTGVATLIGDANDMSGNASFSSLAFQAADPDC